MSSRSTTAASCAGCGTGGIARVLDGRESCRPVWRPLCRTKSLRALSGQVLVAGNEERRAEILSYLSAVRGVWRSREAVDATPSTDTSWWTISLSRGGCANVAGDING